MGDSTRCRLQTRNAGWRVRGEIGDSTRCRLQKRNAELRVRGEIGDSTRCRLQKRNAELRGRGERGDSTRCRLRKRNAELRVTGDPMQAAEEECGMREMRGGLRLNAECGRSVEWRVLAAQLQVLHFVFNI
jgi:hypothetical protein